MSLLDAIVEHYQDEEILKADGFDDAIIGIDANTYRLVYSIEKCIEILVKDDEMTYEDAVDYFGYNVISAYVGEKTPIWVHTQFE